MFKIWLLVIFVGGSPWIMNDYDSKAACEKAGDKYKEYQCVEVNIKRNK